MIMNHRGWRCPKTFTAAIFSISLGATCIHCVPLFTCRPTCPPFTRAFSVTLGLVMVIQGLLAPRLFLPLAILFCDSCITFHGAPPCHGYGLTASLEFLVFLFLLMLDFHTCSVSLFFVHYDLALLVVHICMCVIHILPFSTSSTSSSSLSGCN